MHISSWDITYINIIENIVTQFVNINIKIPLYIAIFKNKRTSSTIVIITLDREHMSNNLEKNYDYL